ncbi:hypothetical protein [Prescottella subtropica]|uniref:WXG100-like domain-containing protein n=1 Tax=Prescottella subtropica TaxID=2545757 RepID=UPI0010F89423|nr:hypothetical protein [Prescottella subtropica]
MGIEIPGALRTVASVAVGQDWPDGDETSLRRVADAWDLAAVALDRVGADGTRAIAPALAAVSGIVNDAVAGKWQQVDASIEDLAAVCRQLADACDATAADVEHAKLSIIAALVTLAAEIAALLAAAPLTAGISTAGAAAAELATQVTVRMILRELLAKLGRDVLTDVLVDTTVSGLLQLGQIAEGNRAGMDWGALGRDAYGSAVSSMVSQGLGGLPGARAAAGEIDTLTGRLVGDGLVDALIAPTSTRIGDAVEGGLEPSSDAGENPVGTGSLNMN